MVLGEAGAHWELALQWNLEKEAHKEREKVSFLAQYHQTEIWYGQETGQLHQGVYTPAAFQQVLHSFCPQFPTDIPVHSGSTVPASHTCNVLSTMGSLDRTRFCTCSFIHSTFRVMHQVQKKHTEQTLLKPSQSLRSSRDSYTKQMYSPNCGEWGF